MAGLWSPFLKIRPKFSTWKDWMQDKTFALLPMLYIPHGMDESTRYISEYLQFHIKTRGVTEESTTDHVWKWYSCVGFRSFFGHFPHVFVHRGIWRRSQETWARLIFKFCDSRAVHCARKSTATVIISHLSVVHLLQRLSSQFDYIPRSGPKYVSSAYCWAPTGYKTVRLSFFPLFPHPSSLFAPILPSSRFMARCYMYGSADRNG